MPPQTMVEKRGCSLAGSAHFGKKEREAKKAGWMFPQTTVEKRGCSLVGSGHFEKRNIEEKLHLFGGKEKGGGWRALSPPPCLLGISKEAKKNERN